MFWFKKETKSLKVSGFQQKLAMRGGVSGSCSIFRSDCSHVLSLSIWRLADVEAWCHATTGWCPTVICHWHHHQNKICMTQKQGGGNLRLNHAESFWKANDLKLIDILNFLRLFLTSSMKRMFSKLSLFDNKNNC